MSEISEEWRDGLPRAAARHKERPPRLADAQQQTWVISISGGYGSYVFCGEEDEAEAERARKASWEGAAGRKLCAWDVLSDLYEAQRGKQTVANHNVMGRAQRLIEALSEEVYRLKQREAKDGAH